MGRTEILVPTFEASRLKSRAAYNKKCAVWAKTGGYCHHCDAALVFHGADSFHMDHLTPKSLGGSNGVENLVPACPHCNHSKWNNEGWTVEQRGPKRKTRFQREMQKILARQGVFI